MLRNVEAEQSLRAENEELRARLEEAEETLRAIRRGELDALVIGEQVFMLESADAASNRFRGEALAQINDAVIAVDNDRRLIYMNPAAEQQYGVRASEELGRPLDAVFRSRWVRPEDEAAAQDSLNSTGAWRGENIHIKRNGEEIYVESTISRLHDGTPFSLLAVVRDITERKRAEEMFRLAVESSPSAMVMSDDAGKIILINTQAERLFGYSRAELVGQSIEVLLPERFRGSHPERRRRFFKSASTRAMGADDGHGLYGLRKDGTEVPVEIGLNPVQMGKERLVLSSVLDITERKRAENALRRSEYVLAQAEQMANLGAWEIDFSSSAEVNENPLFWSDQVYRIFGYEPGSVKVTNELFFRHVPPDERQQIEEAVAAALAGPKPYSLEHNIIRADGAKRVVQEHAIIEVDDAGRPRRIIGAVQDITERKRAEKALHKWAHIFEHAEWGVVIGSADGERFEMMNPAYARMHGYTVEELIGELILKVYPPEQHEELVENIRVANQVGHHVWEAEHVRKDGSKFPVLVDATAIKDEDGRLLYRAVSVRDITAQKLAEDALRESRESFRRLVESANVIAWEADANTNQFTYVSPQAVSLLGYRIEDWYEEDFWPEHIHPDDREYALNLCLESSKRLSHYEFEYRMIAADGRALWLRDIVNVVSDAGGARLLRGFMFDITRSKHIEASLRDSEEQNRKLLANIPDHVTVINREGTLLYINHAPQVFDGIKMLGEYAFSFLESKSRKTAEKYLKQAFQTGETVDFEVTDRHSRVYQNRFVPLKQNKKINLVLSVATDITEQKRAEQYRSHLAERLEMAREDERRHFARQLHDETGQDMVAASIRLHLLEQKLSRLLPGETSVLLEVGKLEKLVLAAQQSIRQTAHALHPSLLERFGLSEALRSFTQELSNLAHRPSATISLHVAPDFPHLNLKTETILYRIVQEAVTNALKHSCAKLISLNLYTKGKKAVILVEDNGGGFDEKMINAESGIGLASIRERAKLIGAMLTISSREGKGTNVMLTLPLDGDLPKTDAPISMSLE